MAQPLALPLLAFAAGILFAVEFHGTCSLLTAFGFSLVGAGLLFSIPLRRRAPLPALLFLLVSLFGLGTLHAHHRLQIPQMADHVAVAKDRGNVLVQGLVADFPDPSWNRTEIVLDVFRIAYPSEKFRPCHGKVLLTIKDGPVPSYGDVVQVRTSLRGAVSLQNPGRGDAALEARLKGIHVRGAVHHEMDLLMLRSDAGLPWFMALSRYREHLRDTIDRHAVSPAREILRASLIGDGRLLPPDLADKFNRTGTSHILAISGFNIGVIAGVSYGICALLLRAFTGLLLFAPRSRWCAAAAMAAIVWYCLLSGAAPSVLRATLMTFAALTAILLGRSSDAMNALCAAALLILSVSPGVLYDVSFQLSFVASAAIIYIATSGFTDHPSFSTQRPSRLRRCGQLLRSFIAVSLAATLATLPIIALTFHRVSLISLLANLLVVPILGVVVIPLSFLLLPLSLLSDTASGLFIHLLAGIIQPALAIIDILSRMPYASVALPKPGDLSLILYGTFLLSLGFCLHGRKPADNRTPLRMPLQVTAVGICLLSVFALVVVTMDSFAQRHRQKILEVTALDVGHGAATVIHLPGGGTVVVDGGGSYDGAFDPGRSVIAPYLWSRGIDRLDLVILTHHHPDHLGGLLYLAEHFQIREIWCNRIPIGTPLADAWLNLVRQKQIPLRQMNAAFPPITLAGTLWTPLGPMADVSSHARDTQDDRYENDASLVMRLVFGKVSFLFPGDISFRQEQNLLQHHRDIASTVLFVPHHGSRHSSTHEFLDRVRPKAAIVSAGRQIPQRFPHADTLRRYAAHAIPLYATNRHGAVTISTDGNRCDIRLVRP